MKIQTEVTQEQILDNLIGAFEGGSSYWARRTTTIVPEGMPAPSLPWRGLTVRGRYAAALTEGCAVEIYDCEGDATHTLTLPMIKSGLEAMAKKCPKHFAALASDDGDGITSDVFLQCCIFGDAIYG